MFLLSTFFQTAAFDRFTQDRGAIVKDVKDLTAPGALPGRLVASGTDSFVFLTGGGLKNPAPLGVAAVIDRGRVAALGHGAFFDSRNILSPGNHRLADNLLGWLTGKRLNTIRIGELTSSGLDSISSTDGFSITRVHKELLQSELSGIDALSLDQAQLDGDLAAQQEVIRFVREGHGLLISGPAWGWQQLNPRKDLKNDLSANRMLIPFGIGFSSDTNGGRYGGEKAAEQALTTEGALNSLKQASPDPVEQRVATSSLEAALTLIPSSESSPLRDEIETKAKLERVSDGPSPSHPFTFKAPFSRLKARLDYQDSLVADAKNVTPDPASATFPGAVASSAKQISKVVQIDLSVPDWHGTGLYAPAGAVIEIQSPNLATNDGLGIRIGSHTDQLWQLPKWERSPAISRWWPLKAPTTRVASPFGGLIFIDVSVKAPRTILSLKISGGVMAPLYVEGKTSTKDWESMLQSTGAPWSELDGKFVSLVVPTKSAKLAVDPSALMAYWDEVMGDCYKFFAAPIRPRAERYCPDQQISAGYMHSGYPIMTWLDVADTFCDVTKLRSRGGPTWGFYHEMGHNFQKSDWTFEGTGEVTNNLFSLFGCESLNSVTPETYELAHKAIGLASRQSRLAKYLADGAPYSEWTKDPFLALTMYAQLRIAFGWKPFTEVFAEYAALGLSERPKTDLEKRDQWMVRFSRKVRKNLSPFFQRWGVPTSAEARASLSNLPEWAGDQWPS